jgi:uncharacterized repeat protein (TIGR02543 family)
MAIDLISAGVKLYYAVETTPGSRPTTLSGYTQLLGVKEIPEINPEPETIESTTLDNIEYKTYVEGLKDLGGSLGFTFNLTQEFVTAWEELISASTAGEEDQLSTWFVIIIPGITKALYFKGKPSPLGLPAISVNSLLEITAYIVPTGEPQWLAKPTQQSVSGFNITFEENGGITIPDIEGATKLPNPLPIPTKENHTFLGWYYDSDFINEALAGDLLTGDVTLYAKWQINN